LTRKATACRIGRDKTSDLVNGILLRVDSLADLEATRQ
jgi:hypothetical protein